MDMASDVEMPSPKRSRVEAPTLSTTAEQADYVDDFSDIYGTPSKEEETKNGGVSFSVSEKADAAPKASSDLPSLPGLPGLGIVTDNAVAASAGISIQLEHDAGHDSGRVPEADMKSVESIHMEISEEQHNNGKILSTDDGHAEVAGESSGSIPETLTSAPVSTPPKVRTRPEEVTPPSKEASNLGAPPALAKVEESVEDPLAFLEASLPPERTKNISEQEVTMEDEKEDTMISAEAPTFEDLASANKLNGEAEFELDSSPLNSDSDSSDDTSSEDSDDEDYKMLGPEEQARRLMAEEGGSDDDGPTAKEKASGPLRTQNEKPDEYVPKPDVIITEEMRIDELGSVEGMVENVVVIKAKTSGEYQVLEHGSVLCLKDRSVVGVIAETLGRVEQPYYSVRFTNVAAIEEAGIVKDTKIFYVEQMSSPVFTQPLRAFKGSDASNLHDEEIGDDELEFSDDEAEAEHKRRVKMQRQQKRAGREGQMDGFSRGPRGGRGGVGRGGGRRGGDSHEPRFGHSVQERKPNAMEAALDYDDNVNEMNVDGEDLYTPLTRPTNLHEIMGSQAGFSETLGSQRSFQRPTHGRGRGRGDRGGGRGSGHGRGPGRGGFGNKGGNSNPQQPSTFLPSPLQQGSSFTQPVTQQYPTNYPAPVSTPQQPYSPLSGQYPPPHWNQPSPIQFPPQQYTDTYPTQPPYQSYQPYPRPLPPTANTPIPAGAHINPAFFMQSQQPPNQQHQQHPQQWPAQQR